MSAQILLEKNQISPDLTRVILHINAPPSDLFGLAFHLKITGSDWSLLRYQLGGAFNKSVLPLVLVNQEKTSDELVFGLSFKDGDKPELVSGELVSFDLKTADPAKLRFEFNNTVVSANNQNRVDLGNVKWSVQAEQTGFETSTQAGLQSLQTNLFDNKSSSFSLDSLAGVYTVLTFGFIILLIGFLAYLMLKKRDNRR